MSDSNPTPPPDGESPSKRDAQLASEIGKAIQQILARGLNDPRIRGLITVTGVDVLDQRRFARVRVTVLPDEHESLTMHGLRAATTHIRKEAMSRVRTRTFPKLEIVLDEKLKHQNEVLSLIARANDRGDDPATERIENANDEGDANGGDAGDTKRHPGADW